MTTVIEKNGVMVEKIVTGNFSVYAQDTGVTLAVVALDITVGKHKEAMQDIVEAVNRPSGGNFGFINIADSENSVFCSEHVTACASIAIVDAS